MSVDYSTLYYLRDRAESNRYCVEGFNLPINIFISFLPLCPLSLGDRFAFTEERRFRFGFRIESADNRRKRLVPSALFLLCPP